MVIEDNKRDITFSEKLESERNKRFKENGIDAKIDKDLNNKRSFTYMTFDNLYAGISFSLYKAKDNAEILRIYERAIKDSVSKGKLKEKDFLFDNLYEGIIGRDVSSGRKVTDEMTDFLLATKGFIYINHLTTSTFAADKLLENTKFPKEIAEIEKHVNLSFFEQDNYRGRYNYQLIDLDYCKERIDKLAKDFNLTDKEKSIYLANIIVVEDTSPFVLNISNLEKFLNKTKDIDKDFFDTALAYRLKNSHFPVDIKNCTAKKLFLNALNEKSSLSAQLEIAHSLMRSGLPKTLKVLSDFFSRDVQNVISINEDVEKLLRRTYYIFDADELFPDTPGEPFFSMLMSNIYNEFKNKEINGGPLVAKNSLKDIINKNFAPQPDYKPGERLQIMEILTRPYLFTKPEGINLSAALSNIYPTINNFEVKDMCRALNVNLDYFDKERFDQWISDYSEARIKYGAPILEVAGMKRRINKSVDEAMERGSL